MNGNTILTENSRTMERIPSENPVQHGSMVTDHRPDARIVTNTLNRLKETPMNPTRLYISVSFSWYSANTCIYLFCREYSCWTRYPSLIAAGAFVSFIILMMVIAILIICLTLGRQSRYYFIHHFTKNFERNVSEGEKYII